MQNTAKSSLRWLTLACLAAVALPGWAQQDRAAERAARRQQQQVQQLQQQVTQAQAEKQQIEQDRGAMEKQLADRARAAARAGAAERAAAERVKALEAEKFQLQQRVADLEKAAQEQRGQADAALAAKDAELTAAAGALRTQSGEREQWQQRFGEQVRRVTECSEKNERLVRLGAELLARWQGKGVVEALRQREPVLGLGDVQMFNLVQDYRDKTENEKFVPRAAGH